MAVSTGAAVISMTVLGACGLRERAYQRVSAGYQVVVF